MLEGAGRGTLSAMRRDRVLPALLVLLFVPGCFDAHGTRSDGGSADASTCEALPASVAMLECEVDAAGRALARITSSPTRCCSSGTVTPSVRAGAGVVDVDLAWSACDCCALCRCIGPIETIDVPLGELAPGTWTVRAGGASCTLTIDAPLACRATPVERYLLAEILFDDQALAVTARAPSGGCGCAPRFASSDPAMPDLSLELCGCCEECECIDGGYEVGYLGATFPVGTHELATAPGATSFEVVSRDACRPMEPTAIVVVSPDPSLRQAGPRIDWIVLEGVERVCCVPPQAAIDRGIGPAGEIALTMYDCVRADCDCVGTEQPVRALHALVDLPPGRHTVRAGTLSATLEVP